MVTIKIYPLILNLQNNATKRRQLSLALLYVQQNKTVSQNKPQKQDGSFSHVIELVTLVNGVLFLHEIMTINFD
jgi:hypothetical protein